MDNLVSAERGASRLNFAQKVVASGMSLILAFGLSPIGQSAAYAGQDEAPIQAAATQVLETQDELAHSATLDGSFMVVTNDVTYDGHKWYERTGSAGSYSYTDNIMDNVISVYALGENNKRTRVSVPTSDGDANTAGETAYTYRQQRLDVSGNAVKDDNGKDIYDPAFTVQYKNANGGAVTDITNAGDYQVVLTGKGSYSGTAVAYFTVKPFNLKDLTIKGAPLDMKYTGKPQAVKFGTDKTSDAGHYPSVEQVKNNNADFGVTSASISELTTNDYNFNPSTVTKRGPQSVTIQGKGNFTGTAKGEFEVGQGVFRSTDLKVNGQAYTGSTDTITLSGNSVPTVSDPDPVGQGKVVFGETTLARGTDYTVQYSSVEDGAATPLDNKSEAPTAVGDYQVLITAVSSDFENNATKTLKINYRVTIGSALDEVAAIADFGSAAYVADTPASTHAQTTDPASGYYFTKGSLAAPTSATFYNENGEDVTSIVGDNYEIVSVSEWDADDEKKLLGDAEYAKRYPYSDAPYQNEDAVAKYFANTVGSTTKSAEKFELETKIGDTTTKDTKLGFNGLPAGDYKLKVQGAGDFASTGTVEGKFTIAPADAVEGTDAGTIKITKGSVGLDKDGSVDIETMKYPVLEQNLGANPYNSNKSLKASPALSRGNAYQVRNGQEDYSVTFMKDGQEVTTSEMTAGTYDVVFTFGGNYTGSIAKAAAFEVGKAELDSVAKYVEIDRKNAYYYTGAAVEPELVFYKVDKTEVEKLQKAVSDAGSDTEKKEEAEAALNAAKLNLKKGEDYAITYRGLTGKTTFDDGKPVGIGSYDLWITGVGNYVTSTDLTDDDKFAAYPLKVVAQVATAATDSSPATYTAGTGFEIAPMDLAQAKTNDYITVLFKDGEKWVENYSAVGAKDSQPKPSYKLVTTATKGDDNPVEVSKDLYTDRFTYTGLNSDGVGTVTLELTGANTAYVTNTKATFDFHMAEKSFTDESVNAQVVLSSKEMTYNKDGQDLTIKVKPDGGAGAELATEFADSTEGMFVWTLARKDGKKVNGKKELKSTDFNEADEAAQIKKFVKNAGEYVVTISGGQKNVYAGTLEEEFTVTPKEIKASDVTVNFGPSGTTNADILKGKFSYNNGNKITAIDDERGVYVDGVGYFSEAESAKNAVGDQYVISGNTATKAGSYVAKIEFAGNYTGSIEKDWSVTGLPIDKADFNILVNDKLLADSATGWYKADTKGYQDSLTHLYEFDAKTCFNEDYDGTAHEPEVVVYDSNYEPVKDFKFTCLYSNNVNASTDSAYAAVTLVANGGDYTGRVTKYFKINPLKIGGDRVTVSFENDDLTWTGSAVEPAGTLTYTIDNGKTITLKKDVDYKVTYTGDNVNVGGNAVAKFTGLAPNFSAGTETFVTKAFSVEENKRADQTITYLGEKAISKKVGDAAFKLAASTNATDGKVAFASSNKAVATVDDSGNVIIVGKGEATITISAAATQLFNAATPVEVKLTVADAAAAPVAKSANSLKIAKVTRTVKGVSKAQKTVAGAKVSTKGQGTVTWKKVKVVKGKKAAAKKVAKKITVNKKNGKITVKKGLAKGTYKVTVSATAAGDATHNAKTAKAVVTLKVKK